MITANNSGTLLHVTGVDFFASNSVICVGGLENKDDRLLEGDSNGWLKVMSFSSPRFGLPFLFFPFRERNQMAEENPHLLFADVGYL